MKVGIKTKINLANINLDNLINNSDNIYINKRNIYLANIYLKEGDFNIIITTGNRNNTGLVYVDFSDNNYNQYTPIKNDLYNLLIKNLKNLKNRFKEAQYNLISITYSKNSIDLYLSDTLNFDNEITTLTIDLNKKENTLHIYNRLNIKIKTDIFIETLPIIINDKKVNIELNSKIYLFKII